MVSISMCFNYDLPIQEQLELIKAKGFKYFSLSGNYEHSGLLTDFEKLVGIIQDSGLRVDTIHGCSASRPDAYEILKVCSQLAQRVGTHIVVIHPCQFFITYEEVDENLKRLLELCAKLEPIAKEYDIRFAIENLHPDAASEVVIKALPLLDERYFGMCYDITHAQIDGPRECRILDSVEDRIIAVHISDRIKEFVDHVVPGEGFIDFNPLIKKLVKNGYTGSLLFEILPLHTQFKDTEKLLEATMKAGEDLQDLLVSFR